MSMPAEIRTARLRLRPMERSDAEAIHRLMTFPVAQYLTSVPWPNTPQDIEGFLESVSGQVGQYTVEHQGEMIGVIGGAQTLGYWYGEAYWGQGFASEAAFAYRDSFFAKTDAPYLRSCHVLANAASSRVLKKIGLQTEGYKVEMLNRTRERAVLRTLCLTRRRWQALTGKATEAKRLS